MICIIGLQKVGLLDFLINLYTVTIINPHSMLLTHEPLDKASN